MLTVPQEYHTYVAPHAGVWIEMEKDELKLVNTLMSHPTQVRSLK